MCTGLSLNEARDTAIYRLNRYSAKYQYPFVLAPVPVLLLCITTSASTTFLLLNELKYQLNSTI